MNSSHLLLLLLVLILSSISVQSSSTSATATEELEPEEFLQHHRHRHEDNEFVSFRPSVAIVIGIFSVIFSLTFLLLVYAKFCHSSVYDPNANLHNVHSPEETLDDVDGSLLAPNSRFSGLDKSVVESLPFFRFSSLKGSREGLDCAVCLSSFDDSELLRLLPRCNHAFHLHCVDQWLESHSTCPLCRTRVHPHDATLFLNSPSRSLLPLDGSPSQPPELELYLERQPHHPPPPSSRFAGSFRWATLPWKSRKGEALLGGDRFHRVKHRVIASDVVFNNRWSDLNPSDLMSLGSEMLALASSKRFDSGTTGFPAPPPTTNPTSPSGGVAAKTFTIKEEMERKRALDRKAIEMKQLSPNSAENSTSSSSSSSNLSSHDQTTISVGRSSSEITRVPRHLLGEREGAEGGGDESEKVRRLWLPIAKRTLQWFNGRERPTAAQPPPQEEV